MGAYISLDDVKAKYTDLTRQFDEEKVSNARITLWIADSEDEIDSYVGARYSLPFAIAPPLLISFAYMLFEYYWDKDNYRLTSTGDEVPWLLQRYREVIKRLQDIQSGKTALYDAGNVKISPSSERLNTLRSNHLEVDQIFSMKDTWDQEVDSDYGTEPEV